MINDTTNRSETFETIIIGGGQAGLAAGYFLTLRKKNFIILDEQPRTGASWRKRWDSLRLFSPSQFDGLPGFPYPKPDNYFPSKDEMADYLESYANQFQLPIRHNIKVERLTQETHGYRILAGSITFLARNVIVATGPYQVPRLPSFAGDLEKNIFQIHTSAYLNPQQIPANQVLVVGAGNSGVEIALELAKAGKHVWLAGRDVGRLPIASGLGMAFGGRPAWWLMSRILTVHTPIGRKAREGFLHHGHPLGRARRQELAKAGVELVGKVKNIQNGKPQLEDNRILPADGVIWATGFRPDYRWIDLPIFDQDGYPRHNSGVVQRTDGLYFLGLLFQTAFNSALLGGVGKDAAYIVGHISRKN